MQLTAKIMLILLSVVALITAAASYFSVKAAYLEFTQQQQQLGEQLGRQLNQRLAVAYARDGMAGVARVLQDVSPDQRADVEMRWVWFEGQGQVRGARNRSIKSLSQVRVGELVSVIADDGQGRRQLHTYVPIRLAADRPGALELTGSLGPVERETRRLIQTALLTIGGLAIASIIVIYIAGVRWVGRPLDALIAKTRRIGQGDFTAPLTISGRGEFAQLARAINEMCDKLDLQQHQLAAQTSEQLATLEQLRHADRLKTVGRLAAGIAHELGTPLNVVAGRAALIASGQLDADQVQASARIIKSEADRITSIVRQLLDFARRRQPQRTVTDLRRIVERTTDLLASLAEKQQVKFVTQLPPQELLAAVDDGQLQQALTNVLLNAIQAMPQGGTATVELASAHRVPPLQPHSAAIPVALLAVTDDGPGIAEEASEHIFEPFYTTKEIGEGTGLGLSIAFGMIQEHGGWIDASNVPPRGARFEICLPRENDA